MFHLFNSLNLEPIESINTHITPYLIISEEEVPPVFQNAVTVASSYEDFLDKTSSNTDLQLFKYLFDTYKVFSSIYADSKNVVIFLSKALKLLFGDNLSSSTAFTLYSLGLASAIFKQKAIYFKGRSTAEFLPKSLSKKEFLEIFNHSTFTGDEEELKNFRAEIRLKCSFEYLVAHLLYKDSESDARIDEKVRRVIFNCFKRTNLENVYLTQLMDYPLYNSIEDWNVLPAKLKKLQNPLNYDFSDIEGHLEEIKTSMKDFYPEFYEFSINHVDCLKNPFGSIEFLKQNIDFLFSNRKVKQVFFDHGDFYDTINRYTLYMFFESYRKKDLDLLREFQLAE
jgi:hypothetical protein